MKPYPKTKPSGVQWLGEVPEHWTPQRVRFCYSIQLGKMLQPEPASPTDEETPYLKSQHVQWGVVRVTDLPTMWTNKKDRLQYAVEDGDLLVCEGGDVGRAATARGVPEGTIIQNAIHRVRPIGENNSSFLLCVLAHAASQGWFEIVCNRSTIAHFTVEKFGALGIALPRPPEQTAIAAYLDRETGRIDELVGEKRELIERLKEKRTALISRAVTRGLPADIPPETLAKLEAIAGEKLTLHPPLKPSGIDWLGDVPEHWGVTCLKYAACKIVDCPHETPSYSQGGEYAVIRTADMIMGALRLEKVYRVDAEEYKYRIRRERVVEGDVLYGREGERWGLAASVPDSPTVCLGQRMMQFRAAAHYSGRFLMWQLNSRSVYEQGALDTTGATAPHVNVRTIRNYRLAEPPLSEQRAIAAYLDEETSKLDALVAKVETAIERLQEYRTALITAAVTGKIDVREDVNE